MQVIKGKEQEYKDWYNKNSDFYGRGCFAFAERWATLLEIAIEESTDTPINVIMKKADKLSHEADINGITGFMYGAAVNILTNCWEYGKELQKWHNEKYNYTEDGVANPAIISF